MSTPCGQLPFHPSPERIRILLHVEAERERTDGDAVAHDHVALVLLDHVGRGDARVVPGVTGIVDDDSPYLLGRGSQEGDRGAPTCLLARARREGVGDDYLARGQAAQIL